MYNPYQNLFQQYQQPYQPYQQAQGSPLNQQINQPQMQSGGFISVATEEEAIRWAVAPGNVMTFKVQGKPIVIEKSMGFSQLEEPKIDKYRLVKEDASEPEPVHDPEYATHGDIDALESEIAALKKDVDNLKAKSQEAFKPKPTRTKEGSKNE